MSEETLLDKIEETIEYYEGCNDLTPLKRDVKEYVKEFIRRLKDKVFDRIPNEGTFIKYCDFIEEIDALSGFEELKKEKK